MRGLLSTAGSAALVAGLLACASPAGAADPASVQKPIQGSSAMGDKGRTGPDGWSWAPQTRDQVPSDTTNKAAANGRGDPNSMPNSEAGKHLPPGQDPGTPVANDVRGPGAKDLTKIQKP